MYTSRSAIECYNCVCKHKRYVQYLYNDGIGLVANHQDISLVFGSAIHLGIEYLLKGASFEDSLAQAKAYLTKYYEANELSDRKSNDITYSYQEHIALAEALLYSYHISEYDYLANNYKVIASELEFDNILGHSERYNEDVILLSKVDAILQHKETGDIQTYSVKTDKELYYQTTETHSNDLQGLTEIWATEQWGSKLIPYKQEILSKMIQFADEKAINTVSSYLDKKYPTFDKVSAVRFCHLVKGKRYQYDDGTVVTINPLIYGYRKAFDQNGKKVYDYAFSATYSNQANKSGLGKLGKGWEKFKVWEDYPTGVIGWIDDISEGLIQPDEANPILSHIIVPEPYYRDDSEVKEAIDASRYQEVMVLDDSRNKLTPISTLFPKNRKACNYPVVCEYKDFCFRPTINANPISSGLYRYRVSHHKKEAEYQANKLNASPDVTELLDKASKSTPENEFLKVLDSVK